MSTNPIDFGKTVVQFIQNNKILCVCTLGLAIVGFAVKELANRMFSHIIKPEGTTTKIDQKSVDVLKNLEKIDKPSSEFPEVKVKVISGNGIEVDQVKPDVIQKKSQKELREETVNTAQEITESEGTVFDTLLKFKNLLKTAIPYLDPNLVKILQNQILEYVVNMITELKDKDIHNTVDVWLTNLKRDSEIGSNYNGLINTLRALIKCISEIPIVQKKIENIFYDDSYSTLDAKINAIHAIDRDFQNKLKQYGITESRVDIIQKVFSSHQLWVKSQIQVLQQAQKERV